MPAADPRQPTPEPSLFPGDEPPEGPMDGPNDDDTTLDDGSFDGAMVLNLLVRDHDTAAALGERREGRDRNDFALDALRIGVLALRHAGGRVDADLVKNAGAELLASLQQALEGHAKTAQQQTATVLKEYFDPQSGRLSERVQRLVADDGELAQLLRSHLDGEASPLARTLGAALGAESPLMKRLDPQQSTGLVSSLQKTVDCELAKQRDRMLSEFSLDNAEGALSRLVRELTGKHGDLSKDLQGKIDEVIKEFSLDKEDSALNKLVRNVNDAQRTISNEFSLDNDASALSRVKRELTTILEAHVKTNAEFQEEVKVTLAKLSQKRASAAASPEHGNDFEEAAVAFLLNEAQRRGDLCEATGATTGAIRNRKVGDAVWRLGPDSPASGAQVVFEAKDAAGYSERSALDELEMARKNRRADFGVFVFAKQNAPEGTRPLARYRNDVIVVWDAEDPATDPYLLAALEIARACVIEFARGRDHEEVDIEGIEKAINEIEKRAANLDDISKWTTTIQSSSEKIMERVRKDQLALGRQVEVLRKKTAALGESKA
ncbi:hypothetical protein Mal64_23600 [Pseudobythopirellula maris]|uniref:Uncharacterized protein n=1 Tax=Pseudobythopirellula maris TaxID=2527991 RepID=A0A5C5ZN17_9BACT|nr:hypothetical protein [Pseudobythopirellula maris]TWT88872.1 hypothetical protein Mal64_23600 [Pseudobythopirellula maris]